MGGMIMPMLGGMMGGGGSMLSGMGGALGGMGKSIGGMGGQGGGMPGGMPGGQGGGSQLPNVFAQMGGQGGPMSMLSSLFGGGQGGPQLSNQMAQKALMQGMQQGSGMNSFNQHVMAGSTFQPQGSPLGMSPKTQPMQPRMQPMKPMQPMGGAGGAPPDKGGGGGDAGEPAQPLSEEERRRQLGQGRPRVQSAQPQAPQAAPQRPQPQTPSFSGNSYRPYTAGPNPKDTFAPGYYGKNNFAPGSTAFGNPNGAPFPFKQPQSPQFPISGRQMPGSQAQPPSSFFSGKNPDQIPGAAAPRGDKLSQGGGTPNPLLAQIEQRESGGRNLPPQANYNYPKSHASGYLQIQPGTWRDWTKGSGIGQQYAQAYDAPKSVQEQVANWAATKYGPNASNTWAASAPRGGYPSPGGSPQMAQAQPSMLSRMASAMNPIGSAQAAPSRAMPPSPFGALPNQMPQAPRPQAMTPPFSGGGGGTHGGYGAPAAKNRSLQKQKQSDEDSQTPPTPRVGEVRKGYRYKGGDPSSPQSWEKVQ